MRSTKSRSRGKSNRNRNTGNNLNRVFDSSGPEGKVRGTPQQIIDKYSQLARDATLSNDRVAAENFQQHSEHYTRMLSESLREAEAKRLQAELHNRERQQRDRDDREARQARQENAQPQAQPHEQPREQPQPKSQPADDPAEMPQPSVTPEAMAEASDDSGLVETPESKPKPKRAPRARKPRPSKPALMPDLNEGGPEPEAAE